MNQDVLEMILVSLVFAVIFGPLTARSSARREKIYGGPLAHALHILAAGAMMGVLPGVLTALILGIPVLTTIAVAFSFLLLSLFLLVLFALVEKPAIPAPQVVEDRGWTAEDARTSGL